MVSLLLALLVDAVELLVEVLSGLLLSSLFRLELIDLTLQLLHLSLDGWKHAFVDTLLVLDHRVNLGIDLFLLLDELNGVLQELDSLDHLLLKLGRVV